MSGLAGLVLLTAALERVPALRRFPRPFLRAHFATDRDAVPWCSMAMWRQPHLLSHTRSAFRWPGFVMSSRGRVARRKSLSAESKPNRAE